MSTQNLRHRSREVALQYLYQTDQTEKGVPASDPDTLIEGLSRHFEHFQVPMDVRPFAALLVAGTLRHREPLDARLSAKATHWKIGRMSAVDRNLLRLAVYELEHTLETPTSVIIDEAVELAKRFGTEESSPFVNGILDALARELRKG